MTDKPIILSKHAQEMATEREVPLEWVETVLRNPVYTEPDRRYPAAIRAYAPIAAFGNRMLRVVYYDSAGATHVTTLFFDRRATRRSRSS